MVAKKRKKFNFNKKKILNIFYIIVISLLFIILIISCFNIYQKRVSSGKDLIKINKEIDELTKEKDILSFTLGETYSDEYLERIAREDLGMQKPGETVYIIKKDFSEEEIEKVREINLFEKIRNWFSNLPE